MNLIYFEILLQILISQMIFFNAHHKHKYDRQITIVGKCITLVETVHFEGVYIDSKLIWPTLSKIISKLRHLLPQCDLRVLYQTLIVPHLLLCCKLENLI